MESIAKLKEMLNQLKLTILAPEFSKDKVISMLESLLLWLNELDNNTDSNCRQIDYFISFEIVPDKRFGELPEDIKGILFDMGATLHDTHTSPEIAENFESTPARLLARVQNL